MTLAIPKNIRLQVRADIARAQFPVAKRARAEQTVVRKIRQTRIMRRWLEANPKELGLAPAPRLRGRPSEALLRAYLLAGLFYAWLEAFGEYPKINNKYHHLTPFVHFVWAILQREGMGKIHQHLEEFRSFRKKAMAEAGFRMVRGVVI